MKDNIVSGFLVGVLGALAIVGVVDKLANIRAREYAQANNSYFEGRADEATLKKQLDSLNEVTA